MAAPVVITQKLWTWTHWRMHSLKQRLVRLGCGNRDSETVFDRKSRLIGFERNFHGMNCQVAVGAWTYYHPSCEFLGYNTEDRVIIGKFCSIAADVVFLVGANHKFTGTTYPIRSLLCNEPRSVDIRQNQGDIVIGNDVWIGHGVTILRSKIGDGAVIGAGAVVRGDIPPYSVVIGNPAQVIRYRFSEDDINMFEQIKWWDWSIEKIRNEAVLLSTDVQAFLMTHSSNVELRHSQ